jgi:3-(3-hydroxy-phenyl)propionate hydroxylase
MQTAGRNDVDVAIIGCGPVGAMLANFLGLCGISVCVLDREVAVYPLPRAIHFDDEVMRVLQTAGLADRVAPTLLVSPGMKFVDAQGRLLIDWSRPAVIGPQGWFPSYRFHQPELEQALRAGLERFAHVTLHGGCTAVGLEERPSSVLVRTQLVDGAPGAIEARFVVGCDGAGSFVRRMMGVGLDDLGFNERWLVVDATLRRPRPDLGDHSVQYCNPQRPATYVRGVGDRRRWEFAVLPGEDEAMLTRPERLRGLLAPWVQDGDVRIERAVVYTFRSALAPEWRRGRLLIAGDAAHLTPPFLGQGMCAGIRDAANLAWKLAAVVQGRVSEDLLDNYGAERAPHVREYIELAIRVGGLINATAMEAAVPRSVLDGGQPLRMTSLKPRLGGTEGAEGTLSPQPALSDGMRLDDRVGYGWAILLKPGTQRRLDPVAAAWAAANRATIVDDPAVCAWLDELGVEAVVLRPDRYVHVAAATLADLGARLDVDSAEASGVGLRRDAAIVEA